MKYRLIVKWANGTWITTTNNPLETVKGFLKHHPGRIFNPEGEEFEPTEEDNLDGCTLLALNECYWEFLTKMTHKVSVKPIEDS